MAESICKISQAANQTESEGWKRGGRSVDGCVLDSFHHILDPRRRLFLLFFVALDNICSLANVINRLKQPKVYLQPSRKSHCRYVLNKDAAALFSSIRSPDELRA